MQCRLPRLRSLYRIALMAFFQIGLMALLPIALTALAGCSGLGPSLPEGPESRKRPAAPAPCMPRFPLEQGWLGGDSAYSVSLEPLADPSRDAPIETIPTLWLFGDSFIGRSGATDRRGSTFVHNSVARSRCRPDGHFEIDYGWGRDPEGEPAAVFDPGVEDRHWWPFDGFVLDGVLHVGLLRVASTGDPTAPFRPVGVDLGRIANPRDAVSAWELEVRPLSRGDVALPAGAFWRDGGHLYLFGFFREPSGRHPRFLVRLPLKALRRFEAPLSAELETLAPGGEWLPGLAPGSAEILMADDATEMSVGRDPATGLLRAVYSFPYQSGAGREPLPSSVVYTRTAKRPEGPWSEPRALFVIPDLREDAAEGHDPAKRCYGAKAHPRFGTPARMVVTYVCNLMPLPGLDPHEVMGRLLDDLGLYRPRVVSWPRPGQPASRDGSREEVAERP